MLRLFTVTRINIILIIIVLILSFLTITWHNQSRLLYREAKSIQQDNQKIIAKQKQLLSKYSELMSGGQIKEKAIKMLLMQRPIRVRGLRL